MKHTLQNQRGETIVEVLVSFLLLMIFTSMFVVSLRYARAMSQKAESLRETAGMYPGRDAAPDWKKEQEGLEFSFGDYGEFTVEGVELDSVETSAKVTENGQETTEQHKFYRYSKSTAEGTTNP